MKEKKLTEEQNSYHIIARFYDFLMGEKKYQAWKEIIADVVRKYNISKGICLDLACGTGNITKLLIELGWQVIGIDSSKNMLEVAKSKFPGTQFILSNVQSFTVPDKDKVTFAVSFYDSLNYLLSDEEMLACFKAVAANMPNNTIFLFDMNTREHVNASQKNVPRIFENEDGYVTFRFGGEDRFWKIQMDFFIKEPDGKYAQVKEIHIERAYDESDIKPLLEAAGFELLEVRQEYKVYEDKQKHLSRLYFVARKK